MSISKHEQDKSIAFTNALNEMLDFVETVLPHINEGQYLEACHNLKVLNDNRSVIKHVEYLIANIRESEVTLEHERRTLMRRRPEYVELSDAEKLKRGWKCCSDCDRLVRNISQHRKSDVCRRTRESKKLSVTAADSHVDEMMTVIHKIRAWAIKTHRYKFY